MPARRDPGAITVSSELGDRLRAERERQAIGVRELSRRVDVSASMISQIERGKVMPSVNTLYALIQALGLSFDELFPPGNGPGGGSGTGQRGAAEREPAAAVGRRGAAIVDRAGAVATDRAAEPALTGSAATGFAPVSAATLAPSESAEQPDIRGGSASLGRVQRKGTHKKLLLGSGVEWVLLAGSTSPDVEVLEVRYEVGGESAPADALMRHDGYEYGIVDSGRLGVTVGFETYELAPGDSISFASTTPHRLFNLLDDRATTGLWVVVGRGGDPRREPPLEH